MCLLLKYLSASDTLSKYNRLPVASFSATTGVFLALFVLSDAANTLLHSPVLIAWRALSVLLIHSKLEAELFSLLPSMWFTCGKFCGLSKNAFATSRCTLRENFLLLMVTRTRHYPLLSFCCLSMRPSRRFDLTRPASLTSNAPSVPCITFQFSTISLLSKCGFTPP